MRKDKPRAHRIVVCTLCAQGERLLANLKRAYADRDFEEVTLAGIDCMAGCEHAHTVGYQAQDKASYLFGDIDPDSKADIDALIAFSKQYADSEEGWTQATERPRALLNKTLARIPRWRPQ